MEDNKKYLYTFSTCNWEIVKREIVSETRYTWKTTGGGSYSKDCHNNWKPNCDHYDSWDLDLETLKRVRKEDIEFRIKMLRRDIERLELALEK